MKRPAIFSKIRFDFIANFVNSRPPRERLLLVALAVACLFFADYFLWLAPVTRSLMETLPVLSSLKQERRQLKEDQKNEALLREKWQKTEADLEEKEKRIAASNQTASLLENLSRLASASGVRILSLKPDEGSPPPGKLYYSVPVHIDCLAGTHELGAFLNRLEAGDVYFRVSNLKIAANPNNERKHSIEMTVETFRKAGP